MSRAESYASSCACAKLAVPNWHRRIGGAELSHSGIQGGPKKTGPFLRVNNFARVNGRKACDMSKVCTFRPE